MMECNTFDFEDFNYPDLCARCAKNEPSQPWKLVFSTIEFPDGPPTPYGNERRVFNDYICRVPVCSDCHGALNRQFRMCWGVGAIVGAIAGLGLMAYMLQLQHIKPLGCYLCGGALAVAVTLGVGYVLKCIVAANAFARYDGFKRTLTFKNKEYQAAFDRANLTLSGTAAASWSGR